MIEDLEKVCPVVQWNIREVEDGTLIEATIYINNLPYVGKVWSRHIENIRPLALHAISDCFVLWREKNISQ